ncbi:cell wall-binding repeat-containing protein [Methanotorris formicicus]|nr:cell wall-binding repeat-containing protein [Methanotorris formicicus]
MWKKLIFLLSLIALPIVSATEVVLVSDNAADKACAVEVANTLNATIITTEWGIYNENLIDEILALNPEKVIVIGGPVAVAENYTTRLENAGIEVERVWGKTRYETNANVTLRFQHQFRTAYGDNATVCVCHGLDDIALNETMEKIRDGHCLMLLTNGVNLSVEPTRLQLKIHKIEVVENPICQFCNHSGIANMLMQRGFKVEVDKIPEDRVKLMLQNRIKTMEMKIKILKNRGVDTSELESKLNEVEELMNQNRYQDAYRIMVQLQGEQMAMVRLHLHPMGHGMAKGMGNKMEGNVPHINYKNTNASGNENVPHIYHQNMNNSGMTNAQH